MTGGEKTPVLLRFMGFVNCRRNGCWEWSACTIRGYGRFTVDGRNLLAHRWIFEYMFGPIPQRLQTDHLCRNRGCVNPRHLEPVTSGENTRRGDTGLHHKVKTQCPHGHEYNQENTYVFRGSRRCRQCHRRRNREFARRKALAGGAS